MWHWIRAQAGRMIENVASNVLALLLFAGATAVFAAVGFLLQRRPELVAIFVVAVVVLGLILAAVLRDGGLRGAAARAKAMEELLRDLEAIDQEIAETLLDGKSTPERLERTLQHVADSCHAHVLPRIERHGKRVSVLRLEPGGDSFVLDAIQPLDNRPNLSSSVRKLGRTSVAFRALEGDDTYVVLEDVNAAPLGSFQKPQPGGPIIRGISAARIQADAEHIFGVITVDCFHVNAFGPGDREIVERYFVPKARLVYSILQTSPTNSRVKGVRQRSVN